MERLLDDTMQQDRFAMLLVALFAAAGLVTAATGVYALLAYTVAERNARSTHAGDDRGRSPHRSAGGELASGAACSENRSGVGDTSGQELPRSYHHGDI